MSNNASIKLRLERKKLLSGTLKIQIYVTDLTTIRALLLDQPISEAKFDFPYMY